MHFINKTKSSYYYYKEKSLIYVLNEILYPHFGYFAYFLFNISNYIAHKRQTFQYFEHISKIIFSGNNRILQYQLSPYWQFSTLSFLFSFFKVAYVSNKSIIKDFFSGKIRDFAHVKAILPIDRAAGMKKNVSIEMNSHMVKF